MCTATVSLLRQMNIPGEVIEFLRRALLLFIIWKGLYLIVLQPAEIPDAWLVRYIGNGTAAILNLVHDKGGFTPLHARRMQEDGSGRWETHTMVMKDGNRSVLGIYAPCNGLELMVLSAGFILCFRGNWKRKVVFIIASTMGLFVVNVLRCALLSLIAMDHPIHFDFAHRYLFNFFVYAFTFVVWMIYVSGMSGQGKGRRSEAAMELQAGSR